MAGLVDEENIGGANNTARFKFVDGEEDGQEFLRNAGEFPWQPGQPNDFNNNENCVESAFYFSEIDCMAFLLGGEQMIISGTIETASSINLLFVGENWGWLVIMVRNSMFCWFR